MTQPRIDARRATTADRRIAFTMECRTCGAGCAQDCHQPGGEVSLTHATRLRDAIAHRMSNEAAAAAVSASAIWQAATDDELSSMRGRCSRHGFDLGNEESRKLIARIDAAEAELFRLCGPACPHDGRRAIEHKYHPHVSNPRLLFSLGDGRGHQSAPEVEAWLRERAR